MIVQGDFDGVRTLSRTWGAASGSTYRGSQALGLGRIAADELDGVAALDRAGAYGAGHAPQADDADAAHGVPAFWRWIERHARPVVVDGCVVNAVE